MFDQLVTRITGVIITVYLAMVVITLLHLADHSYVAGSCSGITTLAIGLIVYFIRHHDNYTH
jgi:uncharacterized membrane protein YGL010W